MKLLINAFESEDNWAGNGDVEVDKENQLTEFIAGLNDTSVIFSFPAGSENKYIEKTVAADVTFHDELVFHIWSRNKKNTGLDFQLASDYAYKIEFGGAEQFFIPIAHKFNEVTLYIPDITSITKVKITALHNDDDYIICSNLTASQAEIPRDIWEGTKEYLESLVDPFYAKIKNDLITGTAGKGILLGTIRGSTGDNYEAN